MQKPWKNDAITMTPKLMETFHYKGRKAGTNPYHGSFPLK
jgi:hypothetical protein